MSRGLARGLYFAALLASPALGQTPTAAVATSTVSHFEHLPVGAYASFTLTITNTGGASLQLAEPVLPVEVSRGNTTCARPVAPQASCDIELIFGARAAGAGAADVVIDGNLAGGPLRVTISWDNDPFPIRASAPALTFEQQIGESGGTQTVTLTNVGVQRYDVAFDIHSSTYCESLGFPAAQCLDRQAKEKASFAASSSCTALAPGESCAIGVRFRLQGWIAEGYGPRNVAMCVAQ